MAEIFISYKSERRKAAEHLAEVLGLYGYSVWFDYQLITGRDFGLQIDARIREAKAMVVLWCSKSVDSRWVAEEVDLAHELGILIPVKIERCDLKVGFRRQHYIDLSSWDGAPTSHDLNPLIEALQQRIGRVSKLDRKGLQQYEAAWRRFGAPSLKAFALGAPLSAVEADRRIPEAAILSLPAEGRIPVPVGDRTGTKTQWLKPGGGEPFCDVGAGPEMVAVPAGRFEMGSPEDEPERESWQKGTESPRHTVTIARPFAVGRHAVTRGQFAAFVAATGHKAEGAYTWTGSEWKLDPKASWHAPGFPQDDDHPVVCVNWDDATAYVKWLAELTGKAYRLLTEAQWEYAARAGTRTPFWWGSAITPAQANYNGNFVYDGGGSKGEYRKGTVAADSFSPNPWGLFNVHGNVWEWCEDVWHDSYQGAPTDGTAWTTGDSSRRVVRGGSWVSLPWLLRAAARDRSTDRVVDLGFRLGRTLTP